MSFKNGVLEASELDFGGPRARFWRVLEPFFRDLDLLAGKMQELVLNLKLKLRNSSLELKLAVLLTSTSKFGRDVPEGRVGGGVPPQGAFDNNLSYFLTLKTF